MNDKQKAQARVDRKRTLREAMRNYVAVREWLRRNEHEITHLQGIEARRDMNRYARLVCDSLGELAELEQNPFNIVV